MLPFLAGGVADVINHYLTLGLPEGAPMESVHRAYQKALHRFHQHQQAAQPLPEADFDALQNAYTELRDPERKAAYDRDLQEERVEAPSLPTEFSGPVQRNFAFTGTGGEYFRIWIVNLLLSILTLGIYSAWAKVRREQYFHRNTLLDGSGFDYHGDPKAILKGRGIAWSMLLILGVLDKLGPMFYWVAVLVLLPVLPWLMLRSFVFRARNTSYRGLRFDFHGSYKAACKVFLGYGLLTLITLGLALPAFIRQIKLFQLNNLSFGGERCASNPSLGAFYGIFLRAVLMAGALILGLGIVFVLMGVGGGGLLALFLDGKIIQIIILVIVVYLFFQVAIPSYIQVRMVNLVWRHSRIGEHRFASDQAFAGLLFLSMTNWLFILLTLGLYWPWAKIRLAAYRAQHTALISHSSLDDFIGQAVRQHQAVGEEIADAFDLDIAI
ncbi:DUF898 family protein [Azonexus sp.]|uniref:DUF898 family protein n=1 Tax=Azonexus sp. TaxID=1872668 RepID=UPI0027BA0411|nr:DUF898 family protein [Azonexus sp.]